MTPVFNVLDLPFSSLCLIETFFMFHRDLPAPVTARSSPILFFSSRYIVSVHKILLRLLSQLGNCSAWHAFQQAHNRLFRPTDPCCYSCCRIYNSHCNNKSPATLSIDWSSSVTLATSALRKPNSLYAVILINNFICIRILSVSNASISSYNRNNPQEALLTTSSKLNSIFRLAGFLTYISLSLSLFHPVLSRCLTLMSTFVFANFKQFNDSTPTMVQHLPIVFAYSQGATYFLAQSFIHSLTCLLTHSIINSYIHSFTHYSFITLSLINSPISVAL